MDLELDGIHILSLIDTGAARSMMKTEVWRELCHKRGQPAISRQGLKLRGLSGQELKTRGKADVRIDGRRCEFYIVDRLSHDALIGDDVLKILKADISYENKSVTLGGRLYEAVEPVQADGMMGGVYAEVDYWSALYPAQRLGGLRSR